MTISYNGMNLDPNRPSPDKETDPVRIRTLGLAAEILAAKQAAARPLVHVEINPPTEPEQPAELNFHGHVFTMPDGAVMEGNFPCKPPLSELLRNMSNQQPPQ